MKTIIAGSRNIIDYELVKQAIEESGFAITEVISGDARGVDQLGSRWANEKGIAVRHFPAQWEKQGRAAGHIRNGQMANVADALIAITTGSPGTASMIKKAQKKGLQIFIKQVSKDA